MEDYEELLTLPRPHAARPMSRAQRAAQFAPFAALVGLDGALEETARQTARRMTAEDTERDS